MTCFQDSIISKYRIVLYNSKGEETVEHVYCRHILTPNLQIWAYANGWPVHFGGCNKNLIEAIACCIMKEPSYSADFSWEEIQDFYLPKEVINTFNQY